MRIVTSLIAVLIGISAPLAKAQLPVLKRSDVVSMYQAQRPVYESYGITVLAWGGTPTPKSIAEAGGIKFFGSVGMVTEFARYYERFPSTYEQGICRDLTGRPYKVPWLTDHQHKGVPFWWCCTRQPLFRQYIEERVVETVRAGAYGVHIDDHLGTSGSLWTGGCFCDRCVGEFPQYLKRLPSTKVSGLGISNPDTFNFRTAVLDWISKDKTRKLQAHTVWPVWCEYQVKGAAEFMGDLRMLAARTAGHLMPMSANATTLHLLHMADRDALDFFSAEIDHHAKWERLNSVPLLAYRMADVMGRPLASTASGQDWAYIKEKNLHGLVQGWVALSYAAGHGLMTPHRKWCYTAEKGTHWYEGPQEKFAPLYRFVRDNASLFDGYENHADVVIAFTEAGFDRDQNGFKTLCGKLVGTNISYRLEMAGDSLLQKELPHNLGREGIPVLVVGGKDFSPDDVRLLAKIKKNQRFESAAEAVEKIIPAVQAETGDKLRVLPRVKPGAAVIHLLNWDYDPANDSYRSRSNVRIKINQKALNLGGVKQALLHAPGKSPLNLPIKKSTVTVPVLDLWAVLELKRD